MAICAVGVVLNARCRIPGRWTKTHLYAIACLNASGCLNLTVGDCRKTLLTLILQVGVSRGLSAHVWMPALKVPAMMCNQ